MRKETITVLNTPCTQTTGAELIAYMNTLCVERQPESVPISVDFTNAHIVALRATDEDFYELTNSVDHFIPDSQVLTWSSGWLGATGHERIYGPDVLPLLVKNCDINSTHYFFGASQDCLDTLIEAVKVMRPDLKIVGQRNGYFQPEDTDSIIADINAVKPDLLWVGLGTPKQQEWIAENKLRLHAGIALAVGFAFDVNAGTKKDAPSFLGPLGLTWVYRLLCEPRRLFARYWKYNSLFLRGFLTQLITSKSRWEEFPRK